MNKKYLTIFCLALIIISTFTITTPILNVNAQDTDPHVSVDKTATAYNTTCGQEILVTLNVTGRDHVGPFDIMLVIDRSASMTGEPLAKAKAAAKSFIDNRTFTGDPATSDWVGVVSYSTSATLNQGLTGNPTLAKSAIDGLTANGYTNIMAGVHVAQQELATHGRDYAMDVMIVLSDGVANRWTNFATGTIYSTSSWPRNHTTSTLKAIGEATTAKNAGTLMFTIGLNLANLGMSEWVARDTLKKMASSLDYFFDAAHPGYLEEIYRIISTYMAPAATDLTLTDIVEDEFIIVPSSITPLPTSVVGNTITWNFGVLGTETKIFQYKIRPIQGLEEGTYPTNVKAYLNYTDRDGDPASLVFPIPTVELYEARVVFFTNPSDIGNITFKGITYANGASDTFPHGTVDEAYANAPEGWTFDHWTTVGNVQVSSTTANPTIFTITCGGNLTAVFRPQEEPPTLDPRTIGFWKHQVKVYLFNRGTAQVTEEELLGYLEQVSLLSNYTKFKQMYVGDNDNTLRNAYRILWFPFGMKARAEQQLLATWLNVVSNKLSWDTPLDSGIYGDLETVGEAITYCENILINSIRAKYEEAKTICDNINNGIGIG